MPLTLSIRLDWRVMAYSIAISGLAMLVIGLAPAIAAVRRDTHSLLKQAQASGNWRGRQFLVVFQVALAALPLSGAGLA